MDYIGEHLLPGQLGHFFIVLSLVASLLATVAYFLSTTSKTADDAAHWKKLARFAFITEVFSVFAIFGILFYIIHNHLFEYKYAWQHSSLSLEFKYLLACFWEGQEGSFMLWSFWHCVLGLILIRKARQWEAPVMTVLSFAQLCLATMMLGVFFFGTTLIKIFFSLRKFIRFIRSLTKFIRQINVFWGKFLSTSIFFHGSWVIALFVQFSCGIQFLFPILTQTKKRNKKQAV